MFTLRSTLTLAMFNRINQCIDRFLLQIKVDSGSAFVFNRHRSRLVEKIAYKDHDSFIRTLKCQSQNSLRRCMQICMDSYGTRPNEFGEVSHSIKCRLLVEFFEILARNYIRINIIVYIVWSSCKKILFY